MYKIKGYSDELKSLDIVSQDLTAEIEMAYADFMDLDFGPMIGLVRGNINNLESSVLSWDEIDKVIIELVMNGESDETQAQITQNRLERNNYVKEIAVANRKTVRNMILSELKNNRLARDITAMDVLDEVTSIIEEAREMNVDLSKFLLES